ncbi:phospholipid-translocating P-type ATPase [Thozetella sp. PMI_491]|nr:phospholipid-translocating P-type ATPase [Thozetella sp. PMI_491]
MAPPKDADEAGRPANGHNKATQRSRWATRKLTVKSSGLKRLSLMGKRHNRTASTEKRKSGGSAISASLQQQPNGSHDLEQEGDAQSDNSDHGGPGPRTLYFNLALPDELKDESGRPVQTYARNKIRTAKYTPLSFIPKNLWFQFHNVANIFFLFLVILVIFPIFGGINAGLNSAPLIFIICVTALKDAIEDYRRSNLDNELNNAPVHRLVGWNNVNVAVDNVSLWRRFKKANTRFFGAIWYAIEGLWMKERKDKKDFDFNPSNEARMSIETTATRRESTVLSPASHQSFVSARENIQMTPVPSPLPRDQPMQLGVQGEDDRPQTSYSFQGDEAALRGIKGDLVNREIQATGKARFHKDHWKNLLVGDFVRIYNDDSLPADIVILATSDPDGACYVETKNLDGETNLKVRSALRCGKEMKHARDCERAQFHIESEAPQPNLYKYNGAIKWQQRLSSDPNGATRSMSEPITIDNVLLRGCNLRNTEWALGVVVFTGHDTKIMMNAGITPSKRPRIARELNFNVIVNFFILFIMCLIAALANGVAWGKTDASLSWVEYGSVGGTPALTGFINFWASLNLLQNLVPISLYISLEIVRTLQAFFIFSDAGMYYEKLDQPCVPKTWNISDDVGQIEYIFSDKTGTLTQNVMEFKKVTINGQPYGEAYTEAQIGMSKRMGVDVAQEGERIRAEIEEAREKTLAGLREINDNPYLHDEDLTFVAPDFVEDLAGKNGEEQRAAVERFMLALALCHTVIAESVPGDQPRMVFKAQSPDEAALVATARDMGFTVLGSNSDGITLNVMGKEIHYPILNTIEFNSTRKRMSAIVKMPDGKIVLFCKGADTIIYSRLKKGEQKELRAETAKHLEMFAVEGFRTLCIAEKVLDEKQYLEWRKEHDLAAMALEGREEKLEEIADKIERDLKLLGGTAIEDRLQEGVPDTIALLGEAGIKLWVLTGDKVETAINIGFSCNLLNNDMDLLRIQVDEDETNLTEDDYITLADQELTKGLARFNMTGSDAELKKARKDHGAPNATYGLVIDGFTLRWVLSDALKQKFLLLCKQCKSVLCCRVSPAQKAAVVSMVKNGLDVMTLSIGDGANDVAMIQEADVGVGIAGEEGRQAVMSSDYAIAQFRFLQRLVLIHGRWSYRRLSETICNFFYKNIVWVFSIFWYQTFADFDIAFILDPTYILMFNLFFTSVPVVLMGVLDQDVNATVSLAVPQLYRRGIERLEWTQTKFWLYMADGFYQSVMAFFIPYTVVCLTSSAAGNGLDVSDRLRLGVYVAHPAVITINLYILLNCYRWDYAMLLTVVLSDAFVFFWTGVYTSFTSAQFFYGSSVQAYQQLTFWMVLLVTPCACVAPRFAIKCIQKTFFPYDVDVIREQDRQGKFKQLNSKQAVTEEPLAGTSSGSSEASARKGKHAQYASVDEDRRPIYPPSVATHNTRTQNGSDGTNYTMHRRQSSEIHPVSTFDGTIMEPAVRPSIERTRPSYDRVRRSMDASRIRASYEASSDFTSAARLSRVESRHSETQPGQRRFNLTTVRKRGLSAFSKKSVDY